MQGKSERGRGLERKQVLLSTLYYMKRKERIAAFGFGYPNSNRGRSSFLGRGKQAGCASNENQKKKKRRGENDPNV